MSRYAHFILKTSLNMCSLIILISETEEEDDGAIKHDFD